MEIKDQPEFLAEYENLSMIINGMTFSNAPMNLRKRNFKTDHPYMDEVARRMTLLEQQVQPNQNLSNIQQLPESPKQTQRDLKKKEDLQRDSLQLIIKKQEFEESKNEKQNGYSMRSSQTKANFHSSLLEKDLKSQQPPEFEGLFNKILENREEILSRQSQFREKKEGPESQELSKEKETKTPIESQRSQQKDQTITGINLDEKNIEVKLHSLKKEQNNNSPGPYTYQPVIKTGKHKNNKSMEIEDQSSKEGIQQEKRKLIQKKLQTQLNNINNISFTSEVQSKLTNDQSQSIIFDNIYQTSNPIQQSSRNTNRTLGQLKVSKRRASSTLKAQKLQDLILARGEVNKYTLMMDRPSISSAVLPKQMSQSPSKARFSPKKMKMEAQAKLKELINNNSGRNGIQSQLFHSNNPRTKRVLKMNTCDQDNSTVHILPKINPIKHFESEQYGLGSDIEEDLNSVSQLIEYMSTEAQDEVTLEDEVRSNLKNLYQLQEEELKRGPNQRNSNLAEPSVFLSLMSLSQKHPIFNKISEAGLKIIFEASRLVFLKKHQILFKEQEENTQVYIPVYGELQLWSKKKGQLGLIKPGFTVGEESICDKNYICRIENAHAENECVLFAIERSTFQDLKGLHRGSSVIKDLNMLEVIFRRNFFIKKHQRSTEKVNRIVFAKKESALSQN